VRLRKALHTHRNQQVRHINGMLQSFIRAQQFFIMSMFMPAIGMIAGAALARWTERAFLL
jgi:hypothetical protein